MMTDAIGGIAFALAWGIGLPAVSKLWCCDSRSTGTNGISVLLDKTHTNDHREGVDNLFCSSKIKHNNYYRIIKINN